MASIILLDEVKVYSGLKYAIMYTHAQQWLLSYKYPLSIANDLVKGITK